MNTISSKLVELLKPQLDEVNKTPLIVGVSGPQGCGKSTATSELDSIFSSEVLTLSLDDFYSTQSVRSSLAKSISPLFATRGPPGTHDVELLTAKLDEIAQFRGVGSISLPKFSKISDDREPFERWTSITSTPRMIVVEGWCMGARVPPDFLDETPLNQIEASDTEMAWRRYQQHELSGNYAELWRRFDQFIHIKTSDTSNIERWRIEQEATTLGMEIGKLKLETLSWVTTFIQHYERITKAMIAGYHEPGTEIIINAEREVVDIHPH